MSHDAAVHMTDSCARTSPAIPNPDFGFDAEVAADVAGEPLAGVNGSSPPIAVPASKANQARPNLSVQVAYDPPEFRTVSPPTWGPAAESSDSPIGGGLMAQKIQRRRQLIQDSEQQASSPIGFGLLQRKFQMGREQHMLDGESASSPYGSGLLHQKYANERRRRLQERGVDARAGEQIEQEVTEYEDADCEDGEGHCFGDEHMLGDEWDGAEEPDDARNVLDSADANGFANGVVQTVHSNAS